MCCQRCTHSDRSLLNVVDSGGDCWRCGCCNLRNVVQQAAKKSDLGETTGVVCELCPRNGLVEEVVHGIRLICTSIYQTLARGVTRACWNP